MWKELAQRILNGYQLTQEDALAVLRAPESEHLQILDAAWTIRRHYFGNLVKANVLSNAKRGLCSEDCHYCGQSQHAQDVSAKHGFLSKEELVNQAKEAKETGGSRFCVTMAVRSASWSAVETLAEATKQIKSDLGMEVCACMGLMTGDTGRAKLKFLKDAGVDAYNHNLNTHEEIYPQICSTHTYQDRMETLHNAQQAGFSLCSGLIIGMGESDEQIAELALTFRREKVDSIPVNFLIAVEGTKLAQRLQTELRPWKALRYLCLFRLANPSAEIRASAGRELHLRSLQNLALFPANSLFLDGYLTQPGQGAEKDLAMIQDLEMEVIAGH